jgi:hypothetical protein
MRLAGALVLVLVGMILCSGCIDKWERETGVKNPGNFPDEFRDAKSSSGVTGSDPADRQKAYEELLKTMDSENGDPAPVVTTSVPSIQSTPPASDMSKNKTSMPLSSVSNRNMTVNQEGISNVSVNQTLNNLTGVIVTPTPAIDYSRIPNYPDILNLGDVYTYGKTGYERDVTIMKYSMKSSFEIKYAARYGTSYKTIDAKNGSTFIFIYPRVAYNGTVTNISMPEPGDFTVLVNNVSYPYYTVPSSYLEDDVSWDKGYTVQGNIIYDEYKGGTLYKGGQNDGLMIYEVPKDAYSGSVLARCEMGYLSYWFKSPKWRLRPEPSV